MELNHREEQLVDVCQQLIRQKSYSGEEGNVAEVIRSLFKEFNFDSVETDLYGNVLGKMKGKYPGPVVVFDGHIDTVPVFVDNWVKPPFAGLVEDGKIYGRGTTDMKGAVAAMIMAAATFGDLTKREFAGEIVISCSVHEECFEGVATRQVSKDVKPDVVVIGEASNLTLKHGQRGRAEIVVETFGKPAHSSSPEKGVNAVQHMMKLISEINHLTENSHTVLGKGILELTDIKSSPYPGASVVPDYCKVTYDRRTLVGETKESILAPIQEIIRKLKTEDASFDATVSFAVGSEKCYTGEVIEAERYFPAWLLEKNDPLVSSLHERLVKEGFPEQLSHYAFCTNGSHFAGEAGIKTIGFGPSVETLAHVDDEYIEITQLVGAYKGYMAIMDELCHQETRIDFNHEEVRGKLHV